MITKTFQAESMIAALETVQREMGPEALIVSVRQIVDGPAWQVWRKPMVEVVAVHSDSASPDQEPSMQPVEPVKSNPPRPVYKNQGPVIKNHSLAVSEQPAGKDEPSGRMAKKQAAHTEADVAASLQLLLKERLGKGLTIEDEEPPQIDEAAPMPVRQPIETSPVLEKYIHLLQQQGVDEDLLQRVSAVIVETLPAAALQDEERVQALLHHQLEVCLRVQKQQNKISPKVICLIGASGVGKTGSCAKLAVYFTKALQRNVSWVLADTVRTGAIAEARTYAEAIGVPFMWAYTPNELANSVVSQANADIVLVDTAACNPRSEASVVELGAFLTALPRRVTWVVMPATVREVDSQNAFAAFGPFRPRGLLLTKMDETNNFGSAFNLAWRSQIPLTYFTCGSRVVDDLIPARADLLVQSMFRERFAL